MSLTHVKNAVWTATGRRLNQLGDSERQFLGGEINWTNIRWFKSYGVTAGATPGTAWFEHFRWMHGEGFSVEKGTLGWKQQEDSVSSFNEFLLLWGLHCSFLPESTGCHRWDQEETLVWNKGWGDITYPHTAVRRQAEQEVTGTARCVMQRGTQALRESLRTLPHVWGPEELDLWRKKKDKMQFRTDGNVNRRLNEAFTPTSVEI